MKVLIIPEDFRKDQFVLKPIIIAILKAAGIVRPRVTVCQDPLLGGVAQATNWGKIQEILARYGAMVELFILCVDRDGQPGQRAQLDSLENAASALMPTCRLIAENAWQEIEVWALAGVKDIPKGWSWASIQSDLNPKENYYLPYVRLKKLDRTPDEGRRKLAEHAAANYARVRQLCSQDVGRLETRLSSMGTA